MTHHRWQNFIHDYVEWLDARGYAPTTGKARALKLKRLVEWGSARDLDHPGDYALPDLEAYRIHLHRRTKKDGTPLAWARDRYVPVGDRAMGWMERYLREVRPVHVRSPDDGHLFLTRSRTHVSSKRIGDMAHRGPRSTLHDGHLRPRVHPPPPGGAPPVPSSSVTVPVRAEAHHRAAISAPSVDPSTRPEIPFVA